MHFLLFSQEILENFLKNFPTNYVFRQNARKFNAGLRNFFLKIDQNNAFSVLFSKKSLKFFSKMSHTIGFFVQSAKI